MRIVAGALRSPEGDAALAAAAEEAVLRGAQLHLVSFVATPQDQQASRHYGRDRDAALAAAETIAAGLRDRGIEVSTHAPTGATSPADAMLTVAREVAADLIVIGLRRRSRVGKLVLGSNAQDILLGAGAAVLAVKAEGEPT